MYLKRIAPILLLTMTTITATAQSFNKGKLDSLLDAIAANNKGMGSLAISKNGQVIYQRAIGYSFYSAAQKTPATVNTRYHIGSITKMFTGVMVFQLIEQGKLSLDTKLSKFYPQLPNANKITIALMLQHRTGLHNFTNDTDFLNYMELPQTEQAMVARFAKLPADFDPDARFEYSNTNFVLLGYIIEKLTKQTYAQALKQMVIAKAGLKDTYLGGKISAANNEANSYKYQDGQWQPAPQTDASVPAGAGAIVSTPTQLTHFIEDLFAGKLISPAHLTLMQTIKDGYGMAMIATPVSGHKGYGHTGGIDGFGSQVIYFPDDKMAIAYNHNGDDGAMGDILIGAINIYFNSPYTIPNFKIIALKPEDLDKYMGVYASDKFPIKITVSKMNNTLVAQGTGQGPMQMKATAANTFEFSAAGIIMVFNPATNQMTVKQGGRDILFTKSTAKTQLTSADLDKYLGVYASPGFPLKITVTKDNTTLMAQATGQQAFPTEATAPNMFEFSAAGIILEFDAVKNEMVLKQAGRTTIFTKEK